jgi:phosphoenolpyruvate carboxykinase (GTP)
LEGLNVSRNDLEQLLAVNLDEWRAELPLLAEHFGRFGDRLPHALSDELAALRKRLDAQD